MTSACISKDAMRNHTQAFLKFKDSIFEICLHLINLNGTLHFLLLLMRSSGAGTSNKIPLLESGRLLSVTLITLPVFNYRYQLPLLSPIIPSIFFHFDMSLNNSLDSTDSDVFIIEQPSDEPSPPRNNTPDILNSTEQSDHQAMRMPSISTIASPQPHIFTIHDDSNEPTLPYGFGWQVPIVPPSLNDLNLPPNPFNILATMTVVDRTDDDNNDRFSPESPDPSLPSSISSPPMSVSAVNRFETTHTTTDDNTFYSDDELRRIYFLPSTPTPPPPRKLKRKLSLGMSFPKEGGVSQHVCEACGQTILSKDTPGPSNRI